MEIQKIKNNEIDQLVVLAKQIWFEYYPPIIGEEQTKYMVDKFHSKEAFVNQIIHEEYVYFKLINDNDFWFGYTGLQKQNEELFISKLYTSEKARGKGYGKLMLEHILQYAEEMKCKTLKLTVNKYNNLAIDFYLRNGFKVSEEAVFDIGKGYVMDDYIMKKEVV